MTTGFLCIYCRGSGQLTRPSLDLMKNYWKRCWQPRDDKIQIFLLHHRPAGGKQNAVLRKCHDVDPITQPSSPSRLRDEHYIYAHHRESWWTLRRSLGNIEHPFRELTSTHFHLWLEWACAHVYIYKRPRIGFAPTRSIWSIVCSSTACGYQFDRFRQKYVAVGLSGTERGDVIGLGDDLVLSTKKLYFHGTQSGNLRTVIGRWTCLSSRQHADLTQHAHRHANVRFWLTEI